MQQLQFYCMVPKYEVNCVICQLASYIFNKIWLYAFIAKLNNCLEGVTFITATKSEDTEPACEDLTSIRDIEAQFAVMTSSIKQALISNNVDVALLIERLCAISAVKNEKVPLFDEDVFKKIQVPLFDEDVSGKIQSVDEFWKRLRYQWNIYDYELLEFIVNISECKEAKETFEEFFSRFDPSTIEDVSLVLDCRVKDREGLLKPVLRIKVKAEKCTLHIKNMVEKMVSEKFNLDKYTLRLQSIKKGCVELSYYISKSLRRYLLHFEVSKDTVKDFRAYKIVSLHIDEFELDTTVSSQ